MEKENNEIAWLYNQLWMKKGARANAFSFKIAETVILRNNIPHAWYFSSN